MKYQPRRPLSFFRPKQSRRYTYMVVGPSGASAYGSEVITIEAGLIAVGTFMLAGIIANHNNTLMSVTDFDSAINWIMAVMIYMSSVAAISGMVAIRFYNWYRGVPIMLAVVAVILAVLGLMEYDDAIVNLSY